MNRARSIYFDCNATTPVEGEVAAEIQRFLVEEFGNEGSRHEFGSLARLAVQQSRHLVAALAGAEADDVIFTSGATESNNIAILGLAAHGISSGRRHIISTQIEHKAVLEPLETLKEQGFEIELLQPNKGGWIEASRIAAALRKDTLLVSVMHANNETGILQPLQEIAKLLEGHPAFFHTDAAQTFAKRFSDLTNPRLDMISISGHKFHGPKGIGALITRKRGYQRVPLKPLMFGGGQERGMRPGTLPVHLIAGMAKAVKLAQRDKEKRRIACEAIRNQVLKFIQQVGGSIHGDMSRCMSHVVNFSVSGLDSEALILTMKQWVSLSNGSACTSARYQSSHVIKAMGIDSDAAQGAVRMSWCHLTPPVPWDALTKQVLAVL